MRKILFIFLWLMLIGGTVSVGWVFWSISEGRIGYMPDMEQLSNPVDKFASQLLTVDGKLMGTYSYGSNNRIFTEYDSIAPAMIQALIATEDERFHEHAGIDFKALFRAIVKRGLLGQKSAGGGSTITQQMLKNMTEDNDPYVNRKVREIFRALEFEKDYTKEQILELYLNMIYLGQGCYGVQTAAHY